MRLPDRMRALILTAAPWWDERTERTRRRKATAAHLRAIRIRKATEQIARRYERADAAFRW